MSYSDLAVRYLQEALERIQADPVSPATLSADMLAFFIALAARDVHHLNDLGIFLTALPSGALEEALLQQAIPSAHRDSVLKLRQQHRVLQDELEDVVKSQRFENAATIRKGQKELIQNIHDILYSTPIQVTPSLVQRALQSLGWQEVLTL